ncbi:MAG: starch-binding protein [Ruminococcus sp.]|nr:starch-binding protein [Ruminococcus sp.]MBQ7134606.1 starch-binding protein [Ruminococcus sp.]
MTKKSISKKLNIFKTSPLISAIAILEVIILICVSTFAWFVFAENNKANTDFISVEPDSGLEIDFNEANDSDYINIWNYLEEFTFEPVTSLDGRNIFVPTTGTFNSTDTTNIKFREATVNDMNSKYINIDFTLTNTGEENMDVYLNSKSYFKFADSANGKALRLAFYQNDGSSGAVSSSILSQQYDGDVPEDGGDDGSSGGNTSGTYTVYLDAPTDWENDPSNVRAYVWDKEGKNNGSFPGVVMNYDPNTKLFSYSYDRAYNKLILNCNGNQNQTVNLDVYDGATYVLEEGRSGTWALDHIDIQGGTLVEDGTSSGSGSSGSGSDGDDSNEGKTTVYFNNTLGWKQPYAYIWQDGDPDVELSKWPGKPMTHISGSIYYYTFNSKYDYIIFNDGNSEGGAVKTKDIKVKDGHIYMISGTNDNGYGWTEEDYNSSVEGGTYPVISPGVSTGFERPYAPVTQIDNSSGSSTVVVPAFASSIDDYNFGSKKLFSIAKGKTLSLSMIVWLEGTDPDCTEDVYSGKDIDMNLIFATSGTGGEDMYTYKFLDKTKENWIDDKIETETGVSFNPVMQLYDSDNQKGYLMKLLPDGYTWTVDAPQDLINSDHIIFRRVNPMDENEVWNYWETKGFGYLDDTTTDSVIVAGGEGENSTVYFTAFSDGAPSKSKKDKDATEEAGAPEYSCGGLWGNHDVQLVTVYDGTDGHWIKNSNIENTTSVLTMNYTYNGQTVEYKASGSGIDVYYFIVPANVYTSQNSSRPAITFKRYYNFNTKYALNSDRNPDITYHRKWNAGACNGKFFEISRTSGGDDHCYWGYDMLYVQAKDIVSNDMNNAFMQVHFYANDNGTDAPGADFYSYLYKNDNFKPDGNGIGYACVVPSDRTYYDYRVERCDPNYHDTKWNISPLHEVVQYESNNVNYPNCVANNICSIENYCRKIYLDCSKSYCGLNNDPECYMWDKDDTNVNNGWPGATMKYEQATSETGDGNYQQYYIYVDTSRYDSIIFNNNGQQTADIPLDGIVSGKIYEWDNDSRWRGTAKSGVPTNESLFTVLYNSKDWP